MLPSGEMAGARKRAGRADVAGGLSAAIEPGERRVQSAAAGEIGQHAVLRYRKAALHVGGDQFHRLGDGKGLAAESCRLPASKLWAIRVRSRTKSRKPGGAYAAFELTSSRRRCCFDSRSAT